MLVLISVDPGKSSGLAVIGYDDSDVRLIQGFQVSGGVRPFRGLLDRVQDQWSGEDVTWLSEKFIPRPGGGFNPGLDSTLPLVCEGVLIDRDLLPEYTPGEKRWRPPAMQYLVGGKDKADKKKRQHKFLKANGFYRTGKDFGTADADDFRSAAAHGIAYIARELKHKPTFELISGWVEGN